MNTEAAPIVNEQVTGQITGVTKSEPSQPPSPKKKLIVGLLFLILVGAAVTMTAIRILDKTKTLTTAQLAPSPSSRLTVDLTAEYQNPFDKNAQYANPFDSYENPFDALK